jgi:tetratricopeptide (TPR) repeat protein
MTDTCEDWIRSARESERQGDTGAALFQYEHALATLDDKKRDPRAADVLRFLGSVFRERGEVDRAEQRYRESYALAEGMAYHDGIAHASNWLGVIAMGRGCLAEAEALFQRARRQAGCTQNERLTGAIEQNLGILTNIRGDLDAAVIHYRCALVQFRAVDDEWMLGLVLNNLGLLHTDLGQWQEAQQVFDEAFDLAVRTGNSMLENAVEVNRAELGIARKDLDCAAAACVRAKTLAQLRNDRQREAEVLKFQGVIARERGDGAAKHLLGEAAALARQCDDRLLMAEVAREFGELLHRSGQDEEARISWARALDLFQALGARLDFQEIQDRLASLAA